MDLSRQRIQVVLAIQIKVDAVVSQGFHVRLTAGGSVALRVWGAHVGRVFPNDVSDCALVFHHLLFALVGGNV